MLRGFDSRLRARDSRRDFALIGLYLLALAWTWMVTLGIGPRYPNGWLGIDATAYDQAWEHGLYLPGAPGTRQYLYSPVFAQVVWPLTHLPRGAFIGVWTVVVAGILWWLLRPLPLVWRVPLFLVLCLEEVIIGNVRAFMALALVLSAGRPGWWAVLLLTKPATGVGVLYYALQRQWGSLARAVGWTAALAAMSVAAAPGLWGSWYDYMTSGEVEPMYGTTVFVVRVVLSIGLVVVAARTDRYWLVVPAVMLASPVINPPAELSLLAAIPRLLPRSRPAETPIEPKVAHDDR